jgi:hypothetical protein
MKNNILRISLTALIGLISLNTFGQVNYSCNPEVAIAVEDQMESFFKTIPTNLWQNYGIKNQGELDAANVGSPLAVYNIRDGELVFGNTWRVPIIVDDHYVALFTVVEETEGSYKIVDFGASVLAAEIDQVARTIDVIGILRVYELREDFLMAINSRGLEEFVSISRQGKPSLSLEEITGLIKNQ